MTTLRGIAVSPGIALGPALVVDPRGFRVSARLLDPAAVSAELERLHDALQAAQGEAEAAEREARGRLEPQYADILAAHVRMITDPILRQDAEERIRRDTVPAERAVYDVLEGHARRLESTGVEHLAARAADVRDILRRILDQLTGHPPTLTTGSTDDPVILLAEDLSPSEAAALDPNRVLGFATEFGGRTSHTAIVAAALEIPAVVGISHLLEAGRGCQSVIIDGDSGVVLLDPDPETYRRYQEAARQRAREFADLARQADRPAETRDGLRVRLLGNIEFPTEIEACRAFGADGIGLFRTEFLYLNAERPPTEEEQLAAYLGVLRALPDRPVTIRTLDLGSDKYSLTGGKSPSASSTHHELNPSLGLRSLRRSLREPALFRPQLRAILRAAHEGDVRVMFPLVTTLHELRSARAIVRTIAAELQSEGVPARGDLKVGAMIEVPAAAINSDLLAKEVDFFSIGTNDLTQYTLAADRTNETVADLYNAADPAVLRLIAMVVASARAAGIEVTVCGSIAGEPLFTMLLLGLGVEHLSTPPHQLPEIKRIIRAIRLEEARALAQTALEQETAERVIDLLHEAYRRALPEAPPLPAALEARDRLEADGRTNGEPPARPGL